MMTTHQRKTWITIAAFAGVFLLAGTIQLMPAHARYERSRDRDRDRYEEREEHFEHEAMLGELELYQDLLELINQFHDIADSETAAAVAAVMGAEDHFEETEDVIDFLEKMIKKTDNPTVQRAIRIKLTEMYEGVGDQKKAVDQVEALITNQPG